MKNSKELNIIDNNYDCEMLLCSNTIQNLHNSIKISKKIYVIHYYDDNI
jgi:hypothetical protein